VDSKPRTSSSIWIWRSGRSTVCPKSFIPASAPSTMSRFTAAAKIRMKRVDSAK
jgi:hypothetical protein